MSSMLSSMAYADCDFRTGITEQADGSFKYTKACHLKVGEMKQDLEIAEQKVEKLNLAIVNLNLAITASDTRADMWRNTAFKMEDKFESYDKLRQNNQLLYFIGGALFTGLAVWGAGYLSH